MMRPPRRGVVIHGAATPPGRLHAAAVGLREMLEARAVPTGLLDLGAVALPDAVGQPIESLPEAARAAVVAVIEADLVAICSPVYRASYPGPLKNLFDLLPVEALWGKPVGILVVGAAPEHYLAVETQLRGVLAWFGAFTLPTAVYLTGADFGEDRQPRPEAVAEVGALADVLADLGHRLAGCPRGPVPLAARHEPSQPKKSAAPSGRNDAQIG